MNKKILFGIVGVLVLGLMSFILLNKSDSTSGAQEIKSQQYGDQIVMTTNLNVTTFRNGEKIPHAADASAWQKAGEAKQPAWAYYNNDPATAKTCGILYNWFAVNDPRGLAPEGWHIPTEEEWKKLGDFLSEKYPRDLTPIKSKTDWEKYGNGDNASGFNAFPCGIRGREGDYSQFGEATGWWSASQDRGGDKSHNSIYFSFSSKFREFTTGQNVRSGGLSVRCMKDA